MQQKKGATEIFFSLRCIIFLIAHSAHERFFSMTYYYYFFIY